MNHGGPKTCVTGKIGHQISEKGSKASKINSSLPIILPILELGMKFVHCWRVMFTNRQRKHERSAKSQLGQFLTPQSIANKIVSNLPLTVKSKVLEPGCGDGSFVLSLIRAFLPLYEGSAKTRLRHILRENIYGIELDPVLFDRLIQNIKREFGDLPDDHNFMCGDFLLWEPDVEFDLVVGNPPFGATINYEHQNALDKQYGLRDGQKIKKESYCFFFVKSFDHLKPNGKITFICSNSFLTIPTMKGLRHYLLDHGQLSIKNLDYFSEETSYPMVIVHFGKTSDPSQKLILNDVPILRRNMLLTDNLSWTITNEDARYFDGPKIGDLAVCTSGMTTGKNAYFIRNIGENSTIKEPFSFEYFDDPITLEKELGRSRLNQLSEQKKQNIIELEQQKATQRNVKISERSSPLVVMLPHPDYRYYNKAIKTKFFHSPRWVIFWKDDGDVVKTFKRNGNWYLHGVGGAPFFGREGFTWSLISNTIFMRYLPPGYILDSSSPCGFLLEGVGKEELYYIIGWCNTNLATCLLKSYINHTRNIQGKDIERMPYPYWVKAGNKNRAIEITKDAIDSIKSDKPYNPSEYQAQLDEIYS